MLRRILFLLTAPAMLLASILTATAAQAQSAHFVGTPSCTKSVSSGLTCNGKAAGLGNGPTQAFLTAPSVQATYICTNKGGNVAPGQPVVNQNVTGPAQDITPRNGQITFSPTIPLPPTPSSPEVCPNGNWNVVLTSLTYTDVTLHIQQPPGTDVLTDNLGTIDPQPTVAAHPAGEPRKRLCRHSPRPLPYTQKSVPITTLPECLTTSASPGWSGSVRVLSASVRWCGSEPRVLLSRLLTSSVTPSLLGRLRRPRPSLSRSRRLVRVCSVQIRARRMCRSAGGQACSSACLAAKWPTSRNVQL